jgi:two-component system response regulator ResD
MRKHTYSAMTSLPSCDEEYNGTRRDNGSGQNVHMAKILVVEDQKFIAQIYEIFLKANNHTVVVATTGAEGMKAFLEQQPDLVITDVVLPDMCGLNVLKFIKFESKVPVIVLTAGGRNEYGDFLEQAVSSGADYAILKPIKPDEVLKVIDAALLMKRHGRA